MMVKIWAKSKSCDKEISLSQHINDVLMVFNRLKTAIKSDDLTFIIKTVIEYHDVGKVLPYFQLKTLGNSGYQPFEVYTNIPHSLFSALLVDINGLQGQLKERFNDQQKAETYTKFALSAIAYHHWRENFFDIVEGFTDVFERLDKLVSNEKYWAKITENLKQVYSEISANGTVKPLINNEWLSGLNNGIRFADYVVPPYQLYRMPKRFELESSNLKDWILISGFTMISDHFASYMESEAEEKVSEGQVEIVGLSYPEIKTAVENELRGKIGSSYNTSTIWQFNYTDKFKDKNTVLLAPTGMGKTEFAYLWSNGDKFFYTLPLRSAVNQIYDRTEKIFGKYKAGILHSDADVYIYGDGGESESMRIYDFARQLAFPAIVSTGDQFFPYALRPPSYEKVFARFSYSRLIIDEVQAYDPKAAAIVVKFIEHVVQMGGKFLLMTATLPGFIKNELEKRIILQSDNFLNLFEKDEQLKNFSKHRICLIIEKFGNEPNSFSNDSITRIVNKAKEGDGKRILIILNTVKQAQTVYNDLKQNVKGTVDIRLFHSRYTQEHRRKIENELEKFMGNNDESRDDKRPKILVATQVVEASLDLDADYLYTELAPWDSLIQRMGRIFRELRTTSPNMTEMIFKRYKQNEIPENIFILIYDGKRKDKTIYESGFGNVYDNELLRTTLKLLESDFVSIEDLRKWNNGQKPEIKFQFIKKSWFLSESDKFRLVNMLFEGLPDKSNYLKDFYNMLQILDAGYMSDRKSEAQKIFREINDASIVPTNQKDDFLKDISQFDFNAKYAYTRFKSDILSKHVVNVQRSKVKEYINDTYLVTKEIERNDFMKKENLGKAKKWLWGIYFAELNYSENDGLVGVKEITSYEFL